MPRIGRVHLAAVGELDTFQCFEPFTHEGMVHECPHCRALRFLKEPAGMCCKGGKVLLPPVAPVPDDLRDLFVNPEFRKNIRKYNMAFAFTSMGVKLDQNLANMRNGIYTFRVNGTIHHNIGTLLPPEGHDHKFAQIYYHDEELQVTRRNAIFGNDLNADVLRRITSSLMAINPYVHLYRCAWDANSRDVSLIFRERNVDQRRYNPPTANEVGIIVVDNAHAEQRDIVVTGNDGTLQRISDVSPFLDPLQYPLFFPFGDEGWSVNCMSLSGHQKRVSMRSFVVARLMVTNQNRETNFILQGGRLFQQYVVDKWAAVEQDRINYVRHNQSAIRADVYAGVSDAHRDGDVPTGRRVILPSSFTGSPRYMVQAYQDSMSLVRKYGKPTFFITKTCNPNWPEVQRELMHEQNATDRPDIIARVFKRRLDAFLHDITHNGILGRTVAHTYAIEFQKRGLPHAHILVWLADEDCPRSADEYDKFVCAEIPDPISQPELYQKVRDHHMHGPCGLVNPSCSCMVNGTCSKKFPKQFCATTIEGNGSFPIYRRRDNGRFVEKWCRGVRVQLDNRYVVPYNPYLLCKYNCHINVEICATVSAVKYIHKYIFKGGDRAQVSLAEGNNDIDETSNYLEGRYITPPEACWRLFGFATHGISHTIYRLPVHLEDRQLVHFRDGERLDHVLLRNERTKLTAFFELCAGENVMLKYHDLPLYYTWNAPTKSWNRRKRQNVKVVGRMYTVSVREGERFYMRMLLSHVPGPKSFADLRTYDGMTYETFKEACLARGLLEDDTEWNNCLTQATTFSMPSTLRQLFATILVFGNPSNSGDLWLNHKDALMEDFIFHGNSPDQSELLAAADVTSHLCALEHTWNDFPGLPALDFSTLPANIYGPPDTLASDPDSLNFLQRQAFDMVTSAVNGNSTSFFLDGPGGTGKTYLYECLSAHLRSQGKTVISVASSGIAATLLTGGRTAHSKFRIPIDIHDNSTCAIGVRSELAAELRNTDLIIWDEIAMVHRHCIEAFDRTMRDLTEVDAPFGGVTVLFGGDLRQILPVVPRGTRGQIVAASIVRSHLWPSFVRLRLTQNMRLQQDETDYADFLLRVGDGTEPTNDDDQIAIPPEILLPSPDMDTLVHSIFPALTDRYNEPDYLVNRVILATRNDTVDAVNRHITNKFPGPPTIFHSADSVMQSDDTNPDNFPVEFLNSLRLNGMSPHELHLKIGMSIIMLRNLNPKMGICNGTRLVIRNLQPNIIDAEISTGKNAGTRVFIPRITMTSMEHDMPFILRRRQFPICACFAMTINKSQGQTLSSVGLYLDKPVFTHGQLYVALSRVRSKQNIKISSPTPFVSNIVYQEALL
jgi:PIF1-like helicase/Helitron helicase-like domain at N-terminus